MPHSVLTFLLDFQKYDNNRHLEDTPVQQCRVERNPRPLRPRCPETGADALEIS